MSTLALADREFDTPGMLGDQPARGASIERGARSIVWTQLKPGRVGTCNYAMLWVTVIEDRMLSGEAVICYAHRRTDKDGPRGPLTDKASDLLRTTMLAAVNRYGFDRLWTETRSAHLTNWAGDEVTRARVLLSYCEHKARATELDIAGLLTFRPIAPDPTGRCFAPLGYNGTKDGYQPVLAEAWCDGTHVGWLSQDLQIIPRIEGYNA